MGSVDLPAASDLPIDAIPRFAANLQAFEAATETETTTSRHNRITANSDLEAKVKEARTLVRKIRAILQFRMRHAPDPRNIAFISLTTCSVGRRVRFRRVRKRSSLLIRF